MDTFLRCAGRSKEQADATCMLRLSVSTLSGIILQKFVGADKLFHRFADGAAISCLSSPCWAQSGGEA
jgi:hypothetical protein